MPHKPLKDGFEILHYAFKNPALLNKALTHPSVSRENKSTGKIINYERLEFLGDGVLGLVIAEMLFKMFPLEREGPLAKRHAGLVKGETVAKIAFSLNIGDYIIMTDGEEAMGGRKNANNVENSLEAIIGAIYLDGGIDPAKEFIHRYWRDEAKRMKEPPKDPKTALQEWVQSRKIPIPSYCLIASDGPAHAPEFTVEVKINGFRPLQAKGFSKKVAEKEAAKLLLARILEDEHANL